MLFQRSGNVIYDLLDIIYNYCGDTADAVNDDEVCQYINYNFNNDVFGLLALAEHYGSNYCEAAGRQDNGNEFCDYYSSFNGDVYGLIGDANAYLAENCIAGGRQASYVCGLYQQYNGNIYAVFYSYCTEGLIAGGRQANDNPMCQYFFGFETGKKL